MREALRELAHEFLRDSEAVARARDVADRRVQRLAPLSQALVRFRSADLAIVDLMSRLGVALRETHLPRDPRPEPVFLWGFKNEEERAFPERLAQAAARLPDLNLPLVLQRLLKDTEAATDDERVNRLVAFADFVADLDSRGAESGPRLGVGPATNFLTFAWHLITDGGEPVFLFDSNKAIKALSESTGDPALQSRDLESRFRVFFSVARQLGAVLPWWRSKRWRPVF
jgi:hypothetical protein